MYWVMFSIRLVEIAHDLKHIYVINYLWCRKYTITNINFIKPGFLPFTYKLSLKSGARKNYYFNNNWGYRALYVDKKVKRLLKLKPPSRSAPVE